MTETNAAPASYKRIRADEELTRNLVQAGSSRSQGTIKHDPRRLAETGEFARFRSWLSRSISPPSMTTTSNG